MMGMYWNHIKFWQKQGWQKSDKISGNNNIQMWANNTDVLQGVPF